MDLIKRFAPNVLLVLVSIVIPILIVDVLLHFTKFRGLIRKEYYPQHYFIADAEMGLDIAPKWQKGVQYLYDGPYPIWSNELGCFDDAYANEEPYIYLTGDSFTWGFTPFEEKWGTILEERIGVRLVKCGVPGFGTKQQLIKTTRDMARLPSPALIIVGYNSSDPGDDSVFPGNTVRDGYRVGSYHDKTEQEQEEIFQHLDRYCVASEPKHPWVQQTKCWLYNHSVLYNILRNNARPTLIALLPPRVLAKLGILVQTTPDSIDSVSEEEFNEHFKHIKAFKELAREEGAQLLFVLIPGKGDVGTTTPTYQPAKEYLQSEGIAYIDVADAFSRESNPQSLFWEHDGHWNPKGNHLAGLAVAAYILQSELVDLSGARVRLIAVTAELKRVFLGK